jgi:hypothetical protein
VRAAGTKDYRRFPMLPGKMVDSFVAQIPAELTTKNLEYFLETFDEDGHGPFRQGSPEEPFKLTVLVAPPVVTVPPPPPLPVSLERPAEPRASTGATWKSPVTVGGVVALGLGAAALVGCGVVGGLALSDYNDEKNASAAGDHDAWLAARDATHTKSVAADALLGVGVAAVAAGAVLVVWGVTHQGGAASSSPVAFGASPTPGGAAAFVSGSF